MAKINIAGVEDRIASESLRAFRTLAVTTGLAEARDWLRDQHLYELEYALINEVRKAGDGKSKWTVLTVAMYPNAFSIERWLEAAERLEEGLDV